MAARVLVVDDEQPILRLVKTVLQLRGYQVVVASSGAAALELCVQQKFDVILADINMPGMNGFDLAKCLRNEGIKAPLLFMTGGLTDVPLELRSAPILQKPFTVRQLLAVIEKAQLQR